MHDTTRDRVRAAWERELDAVDRPGTTVVEGPDGGAVVVSRAGSTQVRVPAGWLDAARAADAEALLSPGWWTSTFTGLDLQVAGPTVHAVRDHWDDGPQPAIVEQVPPWRLGGLRREVDEADWVASGLAGDDVVVAFASFSEPVVPSPWAHRVTEAARRTVVSAAAQLSPWDGAPVDVGVLVDPAYRGRGHGLDVASAATRFAVVEHGLALARVPESDPAALALTARLGFEPVARGLVVTVLRRGRPNTT